MELQEIKDQLKEIIETRLNIDTSDLDVNDDSGLFDEDAWGIDSVDVLDLVLGIEQVFGVSIKQDEEVNEHFASINTLSSYIQQDMLKKAS